MAELFGIDKSGISRHLANILKQVNWMKKWLLQNCNNHSTWSNRGKKTQSNSTNFYNLDAIISVGYRVNSIRATHFRIWATNVLKEYMTKGFVLDDERLKQGKTAFGKRLF